MMPKARALEKAFVFTGIAPLQALLDADGVTEVSVRLTGSGAGQASGVDPGSVDYFVERLAGHFTGLDVLRWQELEPQTAALLAFADSAVYIWFFIIMGALVFGLVNALMTAVLERTREFGLLRAVGMRPSAVILQVLIESTLIMLVGLAVGLGLGVLLVGLGGEGIDLSRWAVGMEFGGLSTRLTPRLSGADVLLIAAMSLGLGVLASLYPAWRAVRVKPVEALGR
jgi:ABC-type lipoprotein release transport system permease subunit